MTTMAIKLVLDYGYWLLQAPSYRLLAFPCTDSKLYPGDSKFKFGCKCIMDSCIALRVYASDMPEDTHQFSLFSLLKDRNEE